MKEAQVLTTEPTFLNIESNITLEIYGLGLLYYWE